MNEQLTPDMQKRVQTLYLYMSAMESGDIEAISSVLGEAEHDHALECMILEANEVYQHEDQTSVKPADVAQVQLLLQDVLPTPEALPMKETPVLLSDRKADRPSKRKATTQVLPAKMIEPRQWYRTRRTWLIGAVAALLIALLLLPNSGVLASQILSLFHVQNFQAVTVSQQDVRTLTSLPIPSLGDLGAMQVQPGSLHTSDNLTEAQAAQMLDFPLLLPHSLPAGITGNPDFSVLSAGQATFTFDASKAHAFLVKNGYGNITIPASLNGATFEVTTRAGVMLSYGNQAETQFMIVEVPSPIIQATGTATLQQLRDFVLTLPGLPADLVTQLKQIDLTSGVVPLPVPAGINSQTVTVQGTSGLLLTTNISTTIPEIKKFPAGSAVVWQLHGIIYALGGTVSDTNQLIVSANSLS